MKEQNFLIGAATAAHQVEGNNIHSDYWIMEHLEGSSFREPSLKAVDHYNRYQEDIDFLKGVGLNAYRFGIEWARVEPENGLFDQNAIEHYKDVLKYCKKNDIEPIVTLYHFSSPAWLIKESGWESKTIVNYFARFVEYTIKEIGHLVHYICTINEANMGLQIAKKMDARNKEKQGNDLQIGLNHDRNEKLSIYSEGLKKIFGKDVFSMDTFLSPRTKDGDMIIMECHSRARKIIKELYPDINVGITLSLHDFQALEGGEQWVESERSDEFFHYLPFLQEDDFIGIQNYTRSVCDANGRIKSDSSKRLTKAGYEFYPEGLEHVLRFAYEHLKKPILITENGISTDHDEERIEFIDVATQGVKKCIDDNIPILGYIHWSLLDNFEWQLGYKQRYGLIEVDRMTFERKPKESLSYLGRVCRQRLIGDEV